MSKKRVSKPSASKPKARFSKFVVGLATDPEKLEQLKVDPEGVMKEAGLSAEEKSIIRSGDAEAILCNIDPKYFEGDKTFSVIIIRAIITITPVMAVWKKDEN